MLSSVAPASQPAGVGRSEPSSGELYRRADLVVWAKNGATAPIVRGATVYFRIGGIPAHPLIIHAAVIFIPLMIVGAIVYAAWPRVRPKIVWAVVALAVIGPLSALLAKLSGQNLRQHLINNHFPAPILAKINQHMSYGTTTLWWTIALGVVTLGVVWYLWRVVPAGGTESVAVRAAGIVVTVALGAFTGYYVFRTGDTGAHIVWNGI
jgi:hypothetical protein